MDLLRNFALTFVVIGCESMRSNNRNMDKVHIVSTIVNDDKDKLIIIK